MENSLLLHGRKAIITGASSGIGRAIAEQLAAQGASVALLARREERLRETAEKIEGNGGTAAVFPIDLRDFSTIPNCISKASDKLDGLDILINAAGVARQASLVDGDFDDWQTMMDVNVLALTAVTKEALRYFPSEGGHIVNISSMSGHRVPGKGGFYAPSKFAVRAITEGLRQELRQADNLTRVSSISPGFVDTELLDEYFATGAGGSKYDKIGYPILQPQEIADLVLHQLTMPKTAEVTDILVRPTGQKT
ncbi:MAG: short-chain dehydrogenase [Verrucomicrobiales bacterium]|nr:short-chain dehydrogenase [Verrucomicrobiales bacterium]